MAAASAQAPPIAHAIGGSLGSALAVLLFYPLERARIELQSQAASSNVPHNNVNAGIENAELESVEVEVEIAEELQPKLVAVGPTDALLLSTSESSSWTPLEGVGQQQLLSDKDLEEEITPSWSMNSSTTTYESTTSQPLAVTDDNKMGLLKCLLRLHARNALYQGVVPIITTIVASQFVFFYMHAYIKNILINTVLSKRKRSLSLLSSCMAGVINVLLTNPLWVVNMAIVTGESQSNSLLKELVTMIKSFGIRHMWKGTSASLLLVSNPVIQFFCYEQMKQARLVGVAKVVLPPIEAFAVGAAAKTIATVFTYPLQLAQTVLRLKENPYEGTLDCLSQLYKRKGFEEWFTGMKAKLLQTVLTAAFTFLTYEQILGAVQSALVKGGQIP
jgi:adenine nucleotide transporter 17